MNRWIWPVVIIGIIVLLPLVLTTYGMQLATEIFIMSIFVLSLGFIIGYVGLVSLGHAAFFGIGAYTVALLANVTTNTYVLILAAIILAGILAFLTGWLFVRTSGAYFLMITLAFNQVVYTVFFKWKDVTGGADGMTVRAQLDLGFGPVQSQLALYYIMAFSMLLCYFLLRRYIAAPLGKATLGVKENEDRMKALGYPIRSYKLIAYTVAGAMAGFAGSLYAFFNRFVSPEVASWFFSGEALVMSIIGGVGTLFGPPIGAGLFVILQNYISTFTARWPMVMGAIFIVFVLYSRGGIAHLLKRLWNRLFTKEEKLAEPAKVAEESKTEGGQA